MNPFQIFSHIIYFSSPYVPTSDESIRWAVGVRWRIRDQLLTSQNMSKTDRDRASNGQEKSVRKMRDYATAVRF